MSDDRRSGASPGDGAIDAAWRRASTEEPSARVDAAILEAARAAARATPTPVPASRPARTRWAHWRTMAAAAAVGALALVLVPRTERQDLMLTAPMQGTLKESTRPAIETTPPDVPAPGRAASSAEMPAPPAAAPAARTPTVAPQDTAPSAAAQAPPAEAVTSAEASAPGPATAPSRGVTAAAADASAGGASPQQWVDRIASLHAAGDLAGAAAALQEFRRAYPDDAENLPPPLRTWAAGVPQEP